MARTISLVGAATQRSFRAGLEAGVLALFVALVGVFAVMAVEAVLLAVDQPIGIGIYTMFAPVLCLFAAALGGMMACMSAIGRPKTPIVLTGLDIGENRRRRLSPSVR